MNATVSQVEVTDPTAEDGEPMWLGSLEDFVASNDVALSEDDRRALVAGEFVSVGDVIVRRI